MISKADIVTKILGKRRDELHHRSYAKAFAPSNIALCKYWGKRDSELNLPVTPSFSISLGRKGTFTELSLSEEASDIVLLNDNPIETSSSFYTRLQAFLDLFFDTRDLYFKINTKTNIPTAAGLASSASGFAALVFALNQFFDWKLSERELSILARLGSGSACRSIWQGFVEWHKGSRQDGMDSYGEFFDKTWPELCIGLLIVSEKEKYLGSREAMLRTVNTSPFYALWPAKVEEDLVSIKKAILSKDFNQLGQIAESNALAMHATMLSAWPPVSYVLEDTLKGMHQIWKLREDGLSLYFTQDAGPNLKLLFLQKDRETICSLFPNVEILQPFIDEVEG